MGNEKAEKTSSLRDNNYYTVQGWMINKLGLKGSELQLYAIIYGFSQTEGQAFSGAAQYLADWTNTTRRNVMERLRTLTERGLIDKEDVITNGVKNCRYRCRPLDSFGCEENSQGDMKKVHTPHEENSQGDMKKVHSPYEENSHNIYSINNTDIDLYKKDNAGAPAPAPSSTKQTKAQKEKINTEEIFSRYTQDEKVLSLLREWLKVRKAKRAPETEKALTLNLDKLKGLALQSGMNQAEYLEAVIARGWAAFYPLGDWNRPTRMPARPQVKTEAQHAAGGHASGFGW